MTFFKKNIKTILVLALLSALFIRLESLHFSLKEIQKSIQNISNTQKNLQATISKNNSANSVKNVPLQKKHQIPVGNSIIIGNKKAPITLIKWTDFQCPYCAQSTSLEKDILKKYPNDVKIVIKNFPLSFHKQARQTALYLLAAHKQGKYKELYYEVSKQHKDLASNPNLVFEISESLGINIRKLKKEAKKAKYSQQIDQEIQQLKNSGMRLAVPKFVLNGQELKNRDLNSWSLLIDSLLGDKKNY